MKPLKRRLPLPPNNSLPSNPQDREGHEFSQWVSSHRNLTTNNTNNNTTFPKRIQPTSLQNKSFFQEKPKISNTTIPTAATVAKNKPQWNSRLVSNGIPDYDSKKDKFIKPKQTNTVPKSISPLANATISSQEEAIQRLKQKNVALMKQVDQLKGTLDQDSLKKDQIIKTLNDTIYHLEQDLKKRTEIVVTAAAPPPQNQPPPQIVEVEEKIGSLKPPSSQSNDRSSKLVHYLEKEKLENKKHQLTISKLEKQIDQYRQTLEEFISRERKSMEENSKLREENDSLKETVTVTEQRIIEANDTIVGLQQQVMELQKRISNFETVEKKRQVIELEEKKQLVMVTKRITALEKEKSDTEVLIEQYKQDSEKQKQNYQVVRNELKEREKLFFTLEQQMESSAKRIAELEAKLKQQSQTVTSQDQQTKQTITQLQQQLTDSEDRAKQLSETNKILLLRIQKLEDR